MAALLPALPSGATLANSTFNAGDGNLDNTNGTQTPDAVDWFNAKLNGVDLDCTSTPKVGCGIDVASGQGDDSFGGGPANKEDGNPPPVTTGSIPPEKSDLTRFYVATSKENNKDFLYLAWERVQEPNGTTNMDFEFNLLRTKSSNGVTPDRSAGDLLVKYDLAKGGETPVLGYHLWVISSAQTPAAVCEAANSFPCWDKVHPLTGFFEGKTNATSVVDPIDPGAPRTLSPFTFGEAGINLTDSGILGSGCTTFGSAFLKSRSADSFTASMKDYIAPINVDISTCGSIQITKTFSLTPATPATFMLKKDAAPTVGTGNPPQTIPGGEDVLFTYPNPATLSGDITPSATSLTVSDGNKYPAAPFYVLIDTEILRVSQKTGNVLTVTRGVSPGTAAAGHSSGVDVKRLAACDIGTNNGTCTFSNLPFGSYWVVETAVPSGFTGEDPKAVTVSPGANGSVTFNNNANPVDVVVVKEDDDDNGINICAATPVQPCAAFELYKVGASSALTAIVTDTATTMSVADATAYGTAPVPVPFVAMVESEIVNVTAVTNNTLTTTRAHLNTNAAGHNSSALVKKLTFDKACVTQVGQNANECTFVGVQPGATYVIVESIVPTGYTKATGLPQTITVSIGNTTANHTYTYTNARKFKVITFVCGEFDGQLYESGIVYDSTTLGSDKTPTSVPSGITEATLCAQSGVYVHGGVAKGDHESKVNIPS